VEEVYQRVLGVTGARRVVGHRRLQTLWSGYGEIFRLLLEGGRVGSVIVKLVQPPAAVAGVSHARKLRSYAVELKFYERYAALGGDRWRTARAFHGEARGGGWLFVLEDLDAAGFALRRASLPLPGVRACLRWLAQFHATFVGAPPEDLWPSGTYWHLATRPDELARSNDPQLKAAAGWLDERLRGARYRTLVHGDAKFENFCFARDLHSVAAVDFQYVGVGCGVQDVAYLFSSCLDDRACEAHAAELLDEYFQLLRAALASTRPELDTEALEKDWRELYPIAWADFCRFMSGWLPDQPARSGYAGYMTDLALAQRQEVPCRSTP
jgi:hypothetical protein